MAQKKFAYGRVSSTDQNEDRQVLEFLELQEQVFLEQQVLKVLLEVQ